ncbi:hypothetical protein CVT25_009088 [Psilocybe cyanescens]|uniref:ER-bound oxygenase mpaB/mpaB'/Rubber oxygenase catalytic domain-containing protein n=1 Tax=Psilocybe cyanescens TaxID=93625 RepID=A0A409VNE9_PSICY|nr:hypothetical protein CVT25_009088 [Psilocybe cyanescens]
MLHAHASPSTYILGGILVWMATVRSLRWRRYHAIHRKYLQKWENGKGPITAEEAQEIITVGAAYDMPLLLNYALAFALFKTYAIPSISELLNKTKQLSSVENVSKRYADTELLIGYVNPSMYGDDTKSSMDDPRSMIALARTNFIHSKYDISNDDYLYTLCLFALEPNTWACRWGWRKLSPLERHAYYVFWAEIGRRMQINDIPDSFESLSEWSKEYERVHMVPAQSNHDLAGFTLEELLAAVPAFGGLKAFGRRLAICLMDDNVREAMLYPKQSRLLQSAVWVLLLSVGVFQRWFLLPRNSPSTPVNVTQSFKTTEGCPRLHPNKWASRPWYRPEPTTPFGLWKEKILVKFGWYSEFPGTSLKSAGYRLEEMGPRVFENAGHEEVMCAASVLQGHPVVGPWSLEGRKGVYSKYDNPSTIFDILHRFLGILPSRSEILEYVQHAPPTAVVAGGILAWLVLVRAFRWRRYYAIHRKYGRKWDNGRGEITPEEAQEIIGVSFMYEMPLLLNYAVAFALFKTYGIPSISTLLVSTRQLKENVSKRYADTELLIATFFGCPISGFNDPSFHPDRAIPADDPRAMIAVARMNYLHSMHRILWASRWGWRSPSPLERHAYYIFWFEIGKRMGIKDIPDSLQGLIEWSEEYEERHMVPAQSNHELAEYTLDELLSAVPRVLGLKTFGKRVAICLMDDRVRVAMMYPEQPKLLQASVSILMSSIGFFQRWLLLPRISPRFPVDVSGRVPKLDKDSGCPRLHPNKWAARPWYRPEPTNILARWREQLLVKIGWYSEMPGPHLKSSGYRIEEMGPPRFENVGREEVMRLASQLQGRPITGPWSLEGRK